MKQQPKVPLSIILEIGDQVILKIWTEFNTLPESGLGRIVTFPTTSSSSNTMLLMPVATLYSLT